MRLHHCVVLCGRSLFDVVIRWFIHKMGSFTVIYLPRHIKEGKRETEKEGDEIEWKKEQGGGGGI